MPRAPLLPRHEIEDRLRDLPGWRLEADRLVKSFKFRDFRAALEFVFRVADPADEQDHHPDVAIHWDTVTLSLWTHASGGVTGRDVRLATTIEDIAAGR